MPNAPADIGALLDVTTALANFAASPTTGHLAYVNTAASSYSNETGLNLPADVQAEVDAANAASTVPDPSVAVGAPASSVPGMISKSGVKIGAILIPWVGVAAIALFVGAAFHFGKRRS